MTKVPKAELVPLEERRTGRVQRGRKSRLALAGLCVYWPAIFVISHIPKEHVPKNVPVSGRAVHLVAYFVLTLLLFLNAGLARRASFRSKKTWTLIVIIAAYAALDEFVQHFIPGRYGSSIDWAVDVCACLLCVGLLRLMTGIRRRRGQFPE